MRVLAIKLLQLQSTSADFIVEPSIAEAFLKLTPLVQFRQPHFIFCDVGATSNLLGGESEVLKKAHATATGLGFPNSVAAIAGNAYTAQALALWSSDRIARSNREVTFLAPLSLDALVDLEGISPWKKSEDIKNVVKFFKKLGFHKIADILHLDISLFRERWGDLGVQIWTRIQQKEVQKISPLPNSTSLVTYSYFDDPVSNLQILRFKLEPALMQLFARMEGLGRFAQKICLTLYCEYSKHQHLIQVEPVSPSRDFNLFLDLLLQKLDSLELENPVREFEIEIIDTEEKIGQMDFFEPRDSSTDRWKKLISLAKQADCTMGFLQVEAAHAPEQSYSLRPDWPVVLDVCDSVEYEQDAVRVKAQYAKALTHSPRPSLILKFPLPVTDSMLSKLQVLSQIPNERIESSWWQLSWKKDERKNSRDYYFAVSEEGQGLWIYQDRLTKNFFLHGYFD